MEKTERDCCALANDLTPGVQTGNCARCGRKGRRVQRITLQSLLEVDLRMIRDVPYWFCGTPDCPVVYFSEDGKQTFTKDQVRVPVFQKETQDPIPVCYCFDFSTADIREEIERTGASTAADQISQGVKDGYCACEITNPQGSCCLGNVRQVEKESRARLAEEAEKATIR